jgi:outer membrane protein
MKLPSSAAHAMTCVLACITVAAHAEVDELVRQAQSANAQGQAQAAYDMLEPHEVERAGDPDFDLTMGIAANGNAQYTRAILALERVLAVQPDNMQARAELGRALFAVGDRKAARALLSESKLEGIPVVAGEDIDQLLQAIDRVDAAGVSSYKGYVELAVGDDSNVNAAPAQNNLAVPAFGGSLVTLAPGSTRTHATFGALGGGLSGRYVIDPRWSLIGNAVGTARDYGNGASEFDTLQVDVNGGVSYRVEKDEFTVVAQVGIYDIDKSRARDLVGAIAEWTYRFDGFRQFSVYGQFSHMTYPQQRIADVDRSVIGVSYAHLMRNGVLAYGGLYGGEERELTSGVPYLGHKLIGVRGGVQKPLSPAFAVFATVGYEERHFGGTDPLFLVSREDRQTNASLGLTWVPERDWRVTPQVSYAEVRSSVPLAAYTRTTVSVAARRDF